MARKSKPSRNEIRMIQLCQQVHLGIDDFLFCECCDPLLEDLQTLDVIAEPGSPVLLAILEHSDSEIETTSDELVMIEERLSKAAGAIRASVGAAIHRKRVPPIRFRVVPRGMEIEL